MSYQSIIRNGNHFIRLDSTGWILIDGPWFDRLPANSRIVSIPPWRPIPIYVRPFGRYKPPAMNFETIEWERIVWSNGHPKILNDQFLSHRYDCTFRQCRYHFGWRIYPDGRLPVLFNALEWDPEMRFYLSAGVQL